MLKKNTIILGRDNEVSMNISFRGKFSGDGLDNFTEIRLNIGGETYSTVDTPASLLVENGTRLILRIGTVTQLPPGDYRPEVIGINGTYDDGYVLTSPVYNPIDFIYIKGA